MAQLSLATFASRSQAVLHLAMAAAVSAAPLPCTTPRSLRGSLQPNKGPAANRIISVSSGVVATHPDLVTLTLEPVRSMLAAVRPAAPARPTAAASPCAKAVQSSTQVRTEGLAGSSRSCLLHGWVTTAMKKVAKGQPAGSP